MPCVACDVPACSGFLSFTAHYECSKCLKWFPGQIGELDYSGFDRHNWPPRTGLQHSTDCRELLNVNSLSEQEKESESGCRYTVLVKLPYFDAPRMAIVDPMHNLFLGSAKHMLKNIWITKDVISDNNPKQS